jgi:serine/threonine-protein kinase RsbW/stage II sporulation protein AB (anti-sigma F factor)
VAGSLPARAESVTELRHLVVEFAGRHGVAKRDRDRIALAITEATTNAVVHAYPPHRQSRIRYLADIEDGDLQIIISDDGDGIRAGHRSPGLGLGLNLIAAMTSDFTITPREPRGLDVWMRFVLDGTR